MKCYLVLLLATGLAGCSAKATEVKPIQSPAAKSDSAKAEKSAAPKVVNIGAEAAAKRIAEDPAVVILDIRTKGEFDEGHLKGAVNIDYRSKDYAAKLGELDKAKTYLVH